MPTIQLHNSGADTSLNSQGRRMVTHVPFFSSQNMPRYSKYVKFHHQVGAEWTAPAWFKG